MTDLSNEPATPRAELSPSDRRSIDAIGDIVKDTTTLDATIAAALNQLNQSLAGYPATAIGASTPETQPASECHNPLCTNTLPCEAHEPAVSLTSPERLAGRRDKAHTDHRQLTRLIRRIHRDTALAARLSQRWGTSGIDAHSVRQRLADALSSVWCVNCAFHGFDKKRDNGEYCEFCSRIKSKYKRYPNHQLCAMNDAGQRCMPSDVTRAFKADKTKDAPQEVLTRPQSITEARERRRSRMRDAS